MNQIDHDNFKRWASGITNFAIKQNGGAAELLRRSSEIPGTVGFVAGYVCGMIARDRLSRLELGGLGDTLLSQHEVRLVHDLVRLKIETEIADPAVAP